MSKTLYYDSNTHQLVIGDCSSNRLDLITIEPTLSADTFKISEDGKLQIKINGEYVFVGDKSLVGPAPQLKIEDGYWYIFRDNGAPWTQLGKATGEDGKDGADGADGEPGEKGNDGITYYTWIKYAKTFPTANTELYDSPDATTEYLGIATNKLEQTGSDNYEDYKWIKFKGDQGVAGEKGEKGDKGEDLTYITAFPEDPEYGDRVIWNGKPIVSDLVPSGMTETGETYEYQNSDSLPSEITKTSYVLQLGTDSANMDEYTTFNIRFTKPVYDLISRKSKLVAQNNICINLNQSYTSLMKNLPSVYLLWKEAKSATRPTVEQQKLLTFMSGLQFESDSSTIPIYCSCYTTSTDLPSDTDYWIPITDLNRAKYSYSLS